jgi:hypothetical protein
LSREEEDRGPKSGRSGNMKECVCSNQPLVMEVGICFDLFLMPLIPMAVRFSYLFLLSLAMKTTHMFTYLDDEAVS